MYPASRERADRGQVAVARTAPTLSIASRLRVSSVSPGLELQEWQHARLVIWYGHVISSSSSYPTARMNLGAERAVAFHAIPCRYQFLGHEYVALITFR